MLLYLRQKNWHFIRHSIVYNVENSEISDVTKTEHFRHCLFYELQQGEKEKDAFESLRKVFGDNLVMYLTVTRWYKRLKRGDFS